MNVRRWQLGIEQGHFVCKEIGNGDWVTWGQVEPLLARLAKAEAALREIANSGAEHPWGGPAAFARAYFAALADEPQKP